MIKDIIKNSVKDLLSESSLSKLWQHINDSDRQFAIISAHFKNAPNNRERHEKLKNRVRELGYGYVELDSGYTYAGEGEEVLIEEQSLMIPQIRKREAVKLGQEFDQEAILWKKDTTFVSLATSKSGERGIGSVKMSFETGPDNMTFDPETVQQAFSSLCW